jgi:hypothetical protein
LDVVLEERQGLAGFEGFEPEVDFAEFDGHGVDVDAVEAAPDDVAEGLADGLRGGFVAGADGGEAAGHPVGGGDQEVVAAAGGVAD